jgi:hypothetical protein
MNAMQSFDGIGNKDEMICGVAVDIETGVPVAGAEILVQLASNANIIIHSVITTDLFPGSYIAMLPNMLFCRDASA